ncbi:MAG: hypothetical protein M1826_000691 [Phylliscum demangeonii]|nr:MAG: hypothetical protein M1826_000691 [Phylliscum demangeonii]
MEIFSPGLYHGKTQRELTGFLRACEAMFRARPVTYNTNAACVYYVVPQLRAVAEKLARLEAENGSNLDHQSWEALKNILRDKLAPAHFRECDSLEDLELDMAPMNEAFRKFHYRQGLHLSIQGVIRACEAYPPSKSAIVEIATTIEQAQVRQPQARSERAMKPPYRGTRKAEGDRDDPKESISQAKRKDRSGTETPWRYGGSTSKCDHCGRISLSEDRCFLKHSHLRDQRPKKRPRSRSAPRGQADEQPKERTR